MYEEKPHTQFLTFNSLIMTFFIVFMFTGQVSIFHSCLFFSWVKPVTRLAQGHNT